MLMMRAWGQVERMAARARAVNRSPPRTTVRAWMLMAEVLMTYAMAEGTPLIIRGAAGTLNSPASARALLTISMVPPRARGARVSKTEKSKLREDAARTRDSSARLNWAATWPMRS